MRVKLLAIDKPMYPPYIPTQLIFRIIYKSDRCPKIVRYSKDKYDTIMIEEYKLDLDEENAVKYYHKGEYKYL
jgi:hypothetical protein